MRTEETRKKKGKPEETQSTYRQIKWGSLIWFVVISIVVVVIACYLK